MSAENSFYTDVSRIGNYLMVRGYENGRAFSNKVKFKPTLYVPTNETDGDKKSLLTRKLLKPMSFETMHDAKEFIERYRDVTGFEICGSTNYATQYIQQRWPNKIKYDPSLVNVFQFDIEVDISEGYANIDTADKEITSISVKSTKSKYYFLFGRKDYDKSITETGIDPALIQFAKFDSELEMLQAFIKFWKHDYPEIITGWNCVPLGQSVWGANSITSIEAAPNDLFQSKLVNSSPISQKEKYAIKLASGHTVYSSKDHKYFVRRCEGENYTKLSLGHKSKCEDVVITAEDMIGEDKTMFLPLPVRKNKNPDNEKYTNSQLYMAGFVYTDGSLKDRHNPLQGYSVYQKNREFMDGLKEDHSIEGSICGNESKGHQMYVNPKLLGDAHDLIYDGSTKRLNLFELSTLSEPQFYHFLSGLLDGDGMVSSIGRIGYCDFNGGIPILVELAQWNGLFSLQSENRMSFVDLDKSKLHTRHERFGKANCEYISRDNSQKAKYTKFKRIGDVYYVRVVDVEPTGEVVDMMDIETSDHSFVSMGVKVHNCEFFDIQYIVTRIIRLFGEAKARELSPWNKIRQKSVRGSFGKDNSTYEISGMTVVDYMDVFKKFGHKYGTQASYKLDHVAHTVLGEKKLSYDEYGDLSTLYEKNPQKYLDYSLKDTYLIQRFEDETAMMALVMTIAYQGGGSYSDALGTTGIWEATLYRKLMSQGTVPPVKSGPGDKALELVGGHVKEPVPGFYRFVMSFDLSSLYPHLMMQYNMSPETLVTDDRKIVNQDMVLDGSYRNDDPRYSVCANGVMFSNAERGVIPEIIDEYYSNRKIVKNEMLKVESEIERVKAEIERRSIAA
jgi:hypothetical protein